MADFLDRFELVSAASVVLDAGCGVGAMVPYVLSRLGPTGRYVGFDVHRPSIDWCLGRFRTEPRLEFHVAPARSDYGSREDAPAERYLFPITDGGADLVLAKSLYTHLLPHDARHYLAETRRALRWGKAAVVTAFLFDPSTEPATEVARAFPLRDESGNVRWRSRSRPASAVAYAKPLFTEMIESAGLQVRWHWPGYYPGSKRPTGQDVLIVGHCH